MPKQSNPGVPEGTEIVFLGEPFGGWADNVTGTDGSPAHYFASIEGTEAATIAKQTTNEYAESDGVTLFRTNRLGHIAPGYVFNTLTDAYGYITGLPLNAVCSSEPGVTWVVLDTGSLIGIDPITQATLNYSLVPSAYAPIQTGNQDIVVTKDLSGSGTEYVLWSWDSYSSGTYRSDIAIAGSASGARPTYFADTWYTNGPTIGVYPQVILTEGVPHKMCIGSEGFLYITNGSYLCQVMFVAGGSIFPSGNSANTDCPGAEYGPTMPLGPSWTAQGVCSYKNYVATIASSVRPSSVVNSNQVRGSVRVFLWNGISSISDGVTTNNAQYEYDIPDNSAQGIFFDGANLYAMTSGRNNSSKLWVLKGSQFVKVKETPFILPSTGSIQGNLEHFQESIMIGAMKADGYPHLFRLYGEGLHDEANMAPGAFESGGIATGCAIGMVKNLYSNLLFVGVKNSGVSPNPYQIVVNNLYDNTYETYQTNVNLRSILYTAGILGRRQYPLGFKGTVNRIQIFLSQWEGPNTEPGSTGSSIMLQLFQDYNQFGSSALTSPATNDLLALQLDTNTAVSEGDQGNGTRHHAFPAGTYEIDISDIAIANLSSFYVNVNWNHQNSTDPAAIIRRMIIYWSPSQ